VKLTFSQSRNFPHFIGPRGSSLCSQETTTCPYHELHQSSLCSPTHLLKIHFNIILPSMPRPSKWYLSQMFHPPKPCMQVSSLSYMCHMPYLFHSSLFGQLTSLWWGVQTAAYHVQTAMYHVQTAMYHVQTATYHVQTAMYHVQTATYHVQTATYHVQTAMYHVHSEGLSKFI